MQKRASGISGTVDVSRRCKLLVRRERRSGTAADGLTCNWVKFFVCLITMVGGRACGQVLVLRPTFMSSSLDGNEWSGSPSGRFYLGGKVDGRLTSPRKRYGRGDEEEIAFSYWDRTPAI
jgi:hypothetical protein